MKYLSQGLVLFLILFAGISHASAGEWQIVGPRALGMGGANVAVANDATASYWNPGAFGFFNEPGGGDYGNRSWSTSLDVGVGVQVLGGLGEQIDKIAKIDFDAIDGDTVEANKVSDLISLLDTLNAFDDGMAINIQANSGLRIQSGNFGIGGVLFADVTAIALPDLVNIGPSDAAALTLDDFTDNDDLGCPDPCSGNTLSGAEITELQLYLNGLGWTATQANDLINVVDNGLSQPGVETPSDPPGLRRGSWG